MVSTTNIAKMAQKDFQKNRKNSFYLNSFNYKFINPPIFTPPTDRPKTLFFCSLSLF